jgi:hypothetical protein
MCIQPYLQLQRTFDVYYCKHVGHGVRFYFLVKEGLLLHPNLRFVDDGNKADVVVVSPGSELEKLIVAFRPPPDANVFAPPRYTLVTLMPAPVPQADTPPVVNTAVVLPAEKPLEVRLVPAQATTGANAKFRPVGRLNVMVAPPTAVCETLNATETPPLVALMVAEFSAFEKVRVVAVEVVRKADAGTAESITVLAAIAA